MIDKSVRNTVEHQYNSSNMAVLHTFDLLQEGVSGREVVEVETGGGGEGGDGRGDCGDRW